MKRFMYKHPLRGWLKAILTTVSVLVMVATMLATIAHRVQPILGWIMTAIFAVLAMLIIAWPVARRRRRVVRRRVDDDDDEEDDDDDDDDEDDDEDARRRPASRREIAPRNSAAYVRHCGEVADDFAANFSEFYNTQRKEYLRLRREAEDARARYREAVILGNRVLAPSDEEEEEE